MKTNFPKMVAALGVAAIALWSVTTASAGDGKRVAPLGSQGFQLTNVVPGTTASDQGLEVGDVIVAVNGNPVRSGDDLSYWLARAGQSAQLDVIDCRTGQHTPVMVYPYRGKIGVDGMTVTLDSPYDQATRSGRLRRP